METRHVVECEHWQHTLMLLQGVFYCGISWVQCVQSFGVFSLPVHPGSVGFPNINRADSLDSTVYTCCSVHYVPLLATARYIATGNTFRVATGLSSPWSFVAKFVSQFITIPLNYFYFRCPICIYPIFCILNQGFKHTVGGVWEE